MRNEHTSRRLATAGTAASTLRGLPSRRTLAATVAAVALLLGVAPAVVGADGSIARAAQDAEAATIAITGGEVHTATGEVIEGGTVLMREGRIAAVGRDVQVPEDARIVDASGGVVTPGLVESYTRLGLVEIGAVDVTNDTRSDDDRITAAFDVTYALNPDTTLIPITRVEGVTRAVVAPGSAPSLIAGQGAVVGLGGPSDGEMVDASPVAVFASLTEAAIESRGGGSRGVAFLKLREALEDVRRFAEDRAAYREDRLRDLALSRLDLEALVPVLRGEVPLAVTVDRASDIVGVLRLAEEYGLRPVLLGAAEGWRVADRIANAGVPVVVDPLTNVPAFDSLGATWKNAARLQDAGVTVALSSFDTHNARNLRFAAGNAVANGLDHGAALASITRVPASIWGVADRFGTLEPERVADVVVWSGDPFEPTTVAEHVFIAGREMPEDHRQKRLLERYRNLDELRPPAFRH